MVHSPKSNVRGPIYNSPTSEEGGSFRTLSSRFTVGDPKSEVPKNSNVAIDRASAGVPPPRPTGGARQGAQLSVGEFRHLLFPDNERQFSEDGWAARRQDPLATSTAGPVRHAASTHDVLGEYGAAEEGPSELRFHSSQSTGKPGLPCPVPGHRFTLPLPRGGLRRAVSVAAGAPRNPAYRTQRTLAAAGRFFARDRATSPATGRASRGFGRWRTAPGRCPPGNPSPGR